MPSENKKRVLIVDDQKSLLWGLEKFLSEKGFEVDTAAEGTEGREKLLAGDYDIAVLDLRLPGKSGLDILEECAGMTRARFILVSAYATADDVEKALTLGAKDYLAKPFEPEALFESISQILYGSGAEKADESITWMTVPAFPDARADFFYKGKNSFRIEAFTGRKGERMLIVTRELDPYESGYLSAVLDSWEDLSDTDALLEHLRTRIPSDAVSAVVSLGAGEALCLQKNAKLLRGKAFEDAGEVKIPLKKGDKLFLTVSGADSASAELPDLPAIDEENHYQGPFFSMASVKTLKDRMFVEPVTSVMVVTYGDTGDLSYIEEDVPSELITREGIIRHAVSLPPSQDLSEAQRNKMHLLLCEAVGRVKEKGGGLNIRFDLEGKRMKSLTVSAEGIGLVSGGRRDPQAEQGPGSLSSITRGQVLSILLEQAFSPGELEITAKKEKMILHF